MEERSIGPGLGADSSAGEIAAKFVGLLVIIYMLPSRAGIFADFVLGVNILLIVAALSAPQALTLPGWGIVLTIGMAVDANAD